MAEQSHLSTNVIRRISGRDAILHRPAMFFGLGLDDIRSLTQIVKNSMQFACEAMLLGICDLVSVTIHRDEEEVEVWENGIVPKTLPLRKLLDNLERYFSPILTAPGIDSIYPEVEYPRNAIRGGFCIGMSFIPAVCSWSRIELYHENEHWMQEYEDGTPVAPFRRIGITHREGINFRFRPDPELFTHRQYDLAEFGRWFQNLDFNGNRARVEVHEKSTGHVAVLMEE